VSQVLADTSDEAYLLRHRKFETLEKRQRLREKEKLQHERYKLKQRIEQLRAMDASVVASSLALTGQSSGGAGDGERLRRELLREAEELEHRYDTLLSEKRESHPSNGFEEDLKMAPLKLRFKLSGGPRPNGHDRHPRSSASPSSDNRTPGINANGQSSTKSQARERTGRSVTTPLKEVPEQSPPSLKDPVEQEKERRSKRPRPSLAATIASLPHGFIPDILRVAPPPNASRSTLRHTLAFGLNIPKIFDEQVEFEVPEEWILAFEGRGVGETNDSDEETMGLVSIDVQP